MGWLLQQQDTGSDEHHQHCTPYQNHSQRGYSNSHWTSSQTIEEPFHIHCSMPPEVISYRVLDVPRFLFVPSFPSIMGFF
jgi:hypothetical protein